MNAFLLSDYARPENPLKCHRCEGTGREPIVGQDGRKSYVFGDSCISCMGSGCLLCIGFGRPGCNGYAAHCFTEPGHDDTCEFHTSHCLCGADLVEIKDSVYCSKCDAKLLAEIEPFVAQARAERADERRIADYYGASTPQTDLERLRAAWGVKRKVG